MLSPHLLLFILAAHFVLLVVIAHWTSGGLTYWAVSDLNMEELETLVGLVQNVGP